MTAQTAPAAATGSGARLAVANLAQAQEAAAAPSPPGAKAGTGWPAEPRQHGSPLSDAGSASFGGSQYEGDEEPEPSSEEEPGSPVGRRGRRRLPRF